MGTFTNALTFHGDPGGFGNIQKWMDMPGSPVSMMHGLSMNKWNSPYGSERNSADEIAGGGSSSQPWARAIGRTVGTAFTPYLGAAKGVYGMTQNKGQDSQQTPGNIFDAAPGLMAGGGQQPNAMMSMMGSDPNLYNQNAQSLASKGRNGDQHLLHITDDELNQLKATGKLTQNPETGLPEAFSLGSVFGGGAGNSGILGPIFQGVGQNMNNNNMMDLAHQASDASNPLAQGQRQPYQGMLANMFTQGGADNFMNTDPSIQAQKRMIGDSMQANFGKSGNMPLTAIMGSAQLANAFGGQYNQRIQDL